MISAGVDPVGALGSQDPLLKYNRVAERMMYWYKNTKIYYFLS